MILVMILQLLFLSLTLNKDINHSFIHDQFLERFSRLLCTWVADRQWCWKLEWFLFFIGYLTDTKKILQSVCNWWWWCNDDTFVQCDLYIVNNDELNGCYFFVIFECRGKDQLRLRKQSTSGTRCEDCNHNWWMF